MSCRGEHNRLGFALQLTTVRYLGHLPRGSRGGAVADRGDAPRQLGLAVNRDALQTYRSSKQRWEHVTKIREHYGYSDFTEPRVVFRLTRWLYGLCWTGTERPSKLFERATAWLLAHKNSVAGVQHARTVRGAPARQGRDQALAPVGTRHYGRTASAAGAVADGAGRAVAAPGSTSCAPDRRASAGRLCMRRSSDSNQVRELGVTLPAAAGIPQSRIAALARFASRAKVTLITRMPPFAA